MKCRIFNSRFFALIMSLMIIPNLSHADEDYDASETFACADAITVMDCIEKTKRTAPHPIEVSTLAINTQEFGMGGPVGAGVRYDTELGWIPEITFNQDFYSNGIFLQLGYGQNEKRANVTLGHGFNTQQQIKITYEYLAQNLPFEFASGDVNQWVSQNAFGAAYRFLFAHQLFRSFEVNGYYIKANNKNLDDIIFSQDNEAYLNLRRIAGGTEETATASISIAPFRNTLISLGGGYSHLIYDTQYEYNQKSTTIAYNFGVEHLFTRLTKLTTGFSHSAAETDSRVRLSQIFPGHIEAAVTGEYSQGLAGQLDSKTITLALSYPVTNYTIPPVDSLDALKNWIMKPVVHANRVLAIKDEAVKKFAITATNPSSQQVQTGELITPVNTKDIFSFDSSLFDHVDYSITSATEINVGLQADNGSVYNSIIYSTAPIPNSAATNGDTTTYVITISAKGYKSGLTAPVEATAQLEINVSSNPNNEPQWDPNKIKAGASINLDVTEIANSINLNTFLVPEPNVQPTKFALQNQQDPNWAIKIDNAGLYYLVRKAGNDNSFDVNFIGNQTVKLLVKYAADADVIAGTPTDLIVTVKAPTDISLQWDSASCVINKMVATQPAQMATPQNFNLIDACVNYTKAGNPIHLLNDQISFTAASTYHGGVAIKNNQMTVNVALAQDINQSFPLTITGVSKAAGQSEVKPTGSNLQITVGNLDIYGTSENEKKITGSHSFNYATLYIHQLNKNKLYTLVSSNTDVSNPDVSLGNANPFVCPRIVNSPDTNPECIKYADVSAIKADDNGEATIIWEYSNVDPQQKDTYINKISLQ